MFRLPFRHALAAAVSGVLTLTLLPANPSHAALPYLDPADCISGRYLAQCYSDFQEGLAAVAGVKADGSGLGYGYIDMQGRMVIAPQFIAADEFSNGLAAVQTADETWGYIDTAGAWVIQPAFADANAFGAAGVAAVRLTDQRYALIDRSGQIIAEFAADSQLQAANADGSLFSVAATPASVIWTAAGRTLQLPAESSYWTDAAHGYIGLKNWPSKYYGVFSLNTGDWALTPAQLETETWPVIGTQAVAVSRTDAQTKDGYWQLLPLDGDDGSGKHYDNLQLADNGTWLTRIADGQFALCDARGRQVVQLASADVRRKDRLIGDRAVFVTDQSVILLGPDGELSRFEASQPQAEWHGGRLWITASTDGDSRLLQIFSAAGKPLLDASTLEALTAYDAEPIYGYQETRPYPAQLGRDMPLASLTPRDSYNLAGILAVNGQIVTNEHWAEVETGNDAWPPLVLKADNGQYGAIDGHGNWVIQPEWDRLAKFHGNYSRALTSLHKRNTMVLLGANGQRYDNVPRRVLDSFRFLSGDLLAYDSGLWDISAGKDLLGDGVEALTMSDAQYIEVKKDGLWGLVDRHGQWLLPPVAKDWEYVAPGVYAAGGSYDDATTRLYNAATGGVIAEGYDQVEAIGANRFALTTGGAVRLIDGHGQTLAQTNAPTAAIDVMDTLVAIRFEAGFGVVDASGQWLIQPTFPDRFHFSAPSGWAVQDYTTVVDRHGKPVLTGFDGEKHLLDGMPRVIIENEQGQLLVDLQGNVVNADHTDVGLGWYRAGNGLIPYVGETGKLGFADHNGQPYIGPYFDELGAMRDDRAKFQMKDRFGELWGYLDRDGHIAITPQYWDANAFSQGLAWVYNGHGPTYIDVDGQPQLRFSLHCGQIVITGADGQRTWPAQAPSCDSATDNNTPISSNQGQAE